MAMRARGQRQSGFFGQLDIGVQHDIDAVQRNGWLIAQQAELGALVGIHRLTAAIFLKNAIRRVDHHRAGRAVDDEHVAITHQLAHVAHGHHGGHTHAARYDGGVGGGAAQVGDERGEAAAAQAQHVRGRNVVRHDHQRVVATHMRHVGQDGRRAGQHMQHPFNYLADVGPALAQVFVFHGIELLAQHLALRRQRPFGVVVSFGDQRQRLLGQ
jgi:hypothetical protein